MQLCLAKPPIVDNKRSLELRRTHPHQYVLKHTCVAKENSDYRGDIFQLKTLFPTSRNTSSTVYYDEMVKLLKAFMQLN